jgi:hypothetical protein
MVTFQLSVFVLFFRSRQGHEVFSGYGSNGLAISASQGNRKIDKKPEGKHFLSDPNFWEEGGKN